MNNKKGSISILSENIHDAMARAEKAQAEVERLKRGRDKAKAVICRLMGEVEGLGYMLASLRARDERWKRAVARYYNEVGIPCQLPNDIFRLLSWPICRAYNGAARAMKDGDLKALEKAVGIKEKS